MRARAHSLKPVIMVGAAGISDAVIAELDAALSHHELVKVRFLGAERATIEASSREICARLEAFDVQRIGRIAVFFRARPEQPAGATARKTPRKKKVRKGRH